MKNLCICNLLVLSIISFVAGCNAKSSSPDVASKTRYTRFNVHVYTRGNDVLVGSAISYYAAQNHSMVPYNTAVTIDKYRMGIILNVTATGRKIYFECPGKWINEMPATEYIELITSDQAVQYNDLSEIDKKGIASGSPFVGMSKQGIMIALGYPAPSYTPSPDTNEWVYWRNRFTKATICFENNKVVSFNGK